MSVSIIIPTFNDNEALAKLLTCIHTWDSQPHEIIVVDALDNKDCQTICQTNDAMHISFKKNRGAQQKFGADKATGSTLWFIHADASPPSRGINFIENAINTGARGGFFKFAFQSEKKPLTQKIISAFTNWRSKHFIAYGDQGIFVERTFYEESGGHADQPLFEEVQIINALRKTGRLTISELPIGVSSRRWEKDGYLTRTLVNRLLAVAYTLGVPADKLAQWYAPKNRLRVQLLITDPYLKYQPNQ